MKYWLLESGRTEPGKKPGVSADLQGRRIKPGITDIKLANGQSTYPGVWRGYHIQYLGFKFSSKYSQPTSRKKQVQLDAGLWPNMDNRSLRLNMEHRVGSEYSPNT